MSYRRITISSGTPITDKVIDYLKNTNMPAIRTMGTTDCDIVQTGPDSIVVIATYPDKATADAAAEKAAALRATSQEEFKGDEPTVLEGEVIVTM